MRLPRSTSFYFFAIPFTGCAAVGMYSIYDSPTGQFMATQGSKYLSYISDAARNTYTSVPYAWKHEPAQSDDPKKKPPPMPY